MATWSNADTLSSWKKLQSLKGMVSVKDELSGSNAAKRISNYSIPMGGSLTYNYAAKQVNEQILKTLSELAELLFQCEYQGFLQPLQTVWNHHPEQKEPCSYPVHSLIYVP